jgi:predicted RNA-binding protein
MCEATAYILKDGKEELLLEGIDLFETGDNEVRLVNIFGEQKTVKARIKALHLVDHRIILEPVSV